jgi:ribosomal protein S18 acetylase RimI-like enzyme
MMPDFRVRPAEPGDLPCLVALYLALQDHLESANPDSWRMTRQARLQLESQIRNRLGAADSCVLVAELAQDGLAGMVFGRIVANARYQPACSGVVDQLFVIPERRRGGIGSSLVGELFRFFAARGVDDVSLRTMHGNAEATAFWSALGFAPRILTLGTRL